MRLLTSTTLRRIIIPTLDISPLLMSTSTITMLLLLLLDIHITFHSILILLTLLSITTKLSPLKIQGSHHRQRQVGRCLRQEEEMDGSHRRCLGTRPGRRVRHLPTRHGPTNIIKH